MLSGQKKGNLVQNGGFEQGLVSWLGVENVDLSSPCCHEGLIAASMGSPASMFQDVCVSPGHVYRFQVSVAAAGEGDPGDLEVEIFWVGPCCEIEPALGCGPFTIQGQTTGFWKTAVLYTEMAPIATNTARICLRTCGGDSRCAKLLVDDVIFVERD